MARPDTSRLSRRVQVNVASAPAPEVGVFAPMDVRAAPSKGALGLASLAQALGTAVDLGLKAKPEFDKKQYEQGKADQALGKVDETKSKWIDAYERGVYESSVLQQYNDAERAVIERAAKELDRSNLSFEEQAEQIDAWMKEELGDLVSDDPRARRLVADRYTAFIEQTTNKILEQTTAEHQRLVLDSTLSDVGIDIRKGGDGRIVEAVERIASFSGDRSQALQAVLGTVTQVADEIAQDGDIQNARAEVERVFSLIPSEIKLEDGTILRPRSSPSIANTLNDAKAQAIDQVERREVEEARKALLDNGKTHIDATNEGRLIPWGWYENLAKRKVIDDSTALSWYDQNRSAHEAKRAKFSSDALMDQWLLDPSKDWRWHNGFTLPDGSVTSEKKFQERFDHLAQQALAAGGPEAFDQVVAMSRRTGLAYTPMKTALSQLNGANVETIAEYFPRYQQLRAHGMAEMYVDEKAMPYWLVAEAMHQTGVDPTTEKGKAQLKDRLTRLEPDRVRQFVQDGRAAIAKKIGAQVINDEGFNTSVDSLGNKAYARAEIMRLAELNLQLQVDPDTALKAAIRQVASTHSPIVVEGEEILVPNEPGLDMKTFKSALEYFEDEILPQAAAREGRTRNEVRFEVTRMGGRETEVRIVDFNGNNIAEGGRFWSPKEIVQLYSKVTGQKANTEARRAQRRKSDMVEAQNRMEQSGEYWNIATDTRY